jgi:16S rRNA processing protein RimM
MQHTSDANSYDAAFSWSGEGTEAQGQQATVVAIGRLTKPHGLRGELVFLPYVCDLKLLPDLTNRWVRLQHKTADSQERVVVAWRPLAKRVLLRLEGCHDVTHAERLRDYEVFIPRWCFPPLPEGEYYWFDIEGLAVYADGGRWLGTIAEIIYTGSNDVYVVWDGTREILVPALKEVVRSIDFIRREVHLFPVPGLLE